MLPVDERNPVIIYNDRASDNWMGEYSFLLSDNGGPPLAGVIITNSKYWGDLGSNHATWQSVVDAARASGLKNIPDLTDSAATPLVRPGDGQLLSTQPNRSPGARLIVDLSRKLSLPSRPLTVLVGTQMTDVADAYLLDQSVVERVVVVAALGSYAAPNGGMGAPNGELDPWADWIVAQRFRYVQISAFYDQTQDVTPAQFPSLPSTPLGAEIQAKQPNLFTIPAASDQVSVLSVGVTRPATFVRAVVRAKVDPSATFDSTQGPPLVPDEQGNISIVTKIAAPLAPSCLWNLLLHGAGRN